MAENKDAAKQPPLQATPDRLSQSFEQAEGLEAAPSQMRRDEITKPLRATLWAYMLRQMEKDVRRPNYDEDYLAGWWLTAMQLSWVNREHRRLDKFSNNWNQIRERHGDLFEKSDYHTVYGLIEFLLKIPGCPQNLATDIDLILRNHQAAFRVVDRKVLCPVSSDQERATIAKAFRDVQSNQFPGARTHLEQAAHELTAGNYSDSVRESIHAVESVARQLEPTGSFSDAISRIELATGLHPALKRGFGAIYGYTSDEKGIRHPLLDNDKASVDETDALFMISACSAFVSYLIAKARSAGLLYP